MSQSNHTIVTSREVCERHRPGVLHLGRPCHCGRWACACGALLPRVPDGSALDEAFEQHLAAAGAPLPTVDQATEELEALLAGEHTRRKTYAKAAERGRDKLIRAVLRENHS